MGKYNRLTPISEPYHRLPNKQSKNKARYVVCKCDCGTEKEVHDQSLKNGRIKSCGCLTKERTSTHGLTNSPIYKVWEAIKSRCYNKNRAAYKDYGGRGITMSAEWKSNFKIFYDWAINNGWQQGLEIDRINNDGNYEPGNCRFVTTKDNSRNRRSVKLTEIKAKHIRILSKTKSRKELSHLFGVSYGCVRGVIENRTWA